MFVSHFRIVALRPINGNSERSKTIRIVLGTQENPRDKFSRKSQIWGCRVLSPWWVGMEWPTIFVLFFTKYWHAQHVWARALLHTIGVMYMDVIVHPVKYVTLSLMSLAAASSAPQLPVSKKPQPVIGREKFVLTLAGTGHFASFHGTRGEGLVRPPLPFRPWLS